MESSREQRGSEGGSDGCREAGSVTFSIFAWHCHPCQLLNASVTQTCVQLAPGPPLQGRGRSHQRVSKHSPGSNTQAQTHTHWSQPASRRDVQYPVARLVFVAVGWKIRKLSWNQTSSVELFSCSKLRKSISVLLLQGLTKYVPNLWWDHEDTPVPSHHLWVICAASHRYRTDAWKYFISFWVFRSSILNISPVFLRGKFLHKHTPTLP